MHSFMFCLFSLPTFTAAFIAYYLYTEYYKRSKKAERILLFRQDLSKLLSYFNGNTKCTSIKKIQGKNKNFYTVKEYIDCFNCTLWGTKISINIYKDDTFNDVNKFINQVIDDLDYQLDLLFHVCIPTIPPIEHIYDILNSND